jgi:photosystem II stability/assembly factor-like uncharacterized protein
MQTIARSLITVLVFFVVPAFGDGLYSVHSANGTEVWAVGNNGLVFRSTNGGASWGTLTRGSATLRSVHTRGSNIWIVGDNGTCFHSSNGGASWSSQVLGGGVTLRTITFYDNNTGWISGNNGTILKTSNGGSSWNSQTSGTLQQLNFSSFADLQTGYVAGSAGTLLKTTNGGTTWTSIGQAGWTGNILSVAASGGTVYVAGSDGFCKKSTDAGLTWSSVDFVTDTKVDIHGAFAVSSTDAYLVGGGGFVRKTTDGGTTWSYGLHQLHAKLNSVFFHSRTDGWACSERNNVILRTTDEGMTWQLPTGTSVTYQWQQKTANLSTIGNTFCVNPWNKNIIYFVSGSTVYLSGDLGETWVSTATIGGGGSTWSFYVSPKDTNVWLAATSGTGGKGVRRTTNRGVSWSTPILRNFTNFGMPLEMDPDRPDTVLFAEDQGTAGTAPLYRSTNFGATWDTLGQFRFRSPCDMYIVPDTVGLVYLADGVTGSGNAQMWRSTNAGLNWTSIYTSPSSEIPMVAVSRLRKNQAFATAWSGTSVMKSVNAGTSWSSIATTVSTWGADVAKDDPNLFMYGTYGGSTSFLSTNAGSTFTSTTLTGSNSGMLCYDRATFLAHQASGGVWKYNIGYTVPSSPAQIISVVSPNGGEVWGIGTTQTITWATYGVSGNVKVELSRDGGSGYETLFESTVNDGSEPWLVSGPATTSAHVRVSSINNPATADVSNGLFSIGAAFSFLTNLVLRDNGGEVDTLEYGIGAGATDGIDELFGEQELPPPPPIGAFDVRWQITGTQGVKRDVRDTLGGSHIQTVYQGRLQEGPGGYPFRIAWNSSAMPEGTFLLRDGLGGTRFSVNMKLMDSLMISDPEVTAFQLVHTNSSVVSGSVEGGWNVVSLPVRVSDRRKTAVFPSSISNAFTYTPFGYSNRDTLDYGVGYWLKFPSLQALLLAGDFILLDTIDVVQGWNMIGSITGEVPVLSIIQDPNGIVASPYYGYSSTGYAPASTIEPMKGYWVKVNQTGRLLLSGSNVASPATSIPLRR